MSDKDWWINRVKQRESEKMTGNIQLNMCEGEVKNLNVNTVERKPKNNKGVE